MLVGAQCSQLLSHSDKEMVWTGGMKYGGGGGACPVKTPNVMGTLLAVYLLLQQKTQV